MALIQVNADLSKAVGVLERIARALEVGVLRMWGIRMGHCAEVTADPHPSEKETLTYETDESALRAELQQVHRGRRADQPIGDEDEEFGI